MLWCKVPSPVWESLSPTGTSVCSCGYIQYLVTSWRHMVADLFLSHFQTCGKVQQSIFFFNKRHHVGGSKHRARSVVFLESYGGAFLMINQLHHPNLIVGKQSFQHSAVRSFIPQSNSTQLGELKLHFFIFAPETWNLKPKPTCYACDDLHKEQRGSVVTCKWRQGLD